MAKLTGPLLSMGARGQIGNAFVTAKWKGIPYARQYVIPANPRTTAQQENRTRFALLREMYKLAPAAAIAPWAAFVQGRPLLPVNKFVGENNRLLVGQSDLSAMQMSPGAKGGLPPLSVVSTTGAAPGEVDIAVTVPTQLPDGWAVDSIGAAAVIDQNPVGIFSGPFVASTAASPATSITLGGMGSGAECMSWGWVVYEKPNGDLAYSVSLSDAVTAGA